MKRQRSLPALLVGGLLLVAACGDDDDTDSTDTGATTATQSTEAPSTEAATTEPAPTEPATTETPSTQAPSTEPPTTEEASVDAFCQAELDVEAAAASAGPEASPEDLEAIEPAFTALQEAAPDDISGSVETAITEFLAADGEPGEEFEAAYAEVIAYVSDNCGFGTLDVLAKDYSFGGIGPEVPAGPTVINLTNDGTELHEVALIRKNDDVTESFEELLALPEEEAMKKTTFAGVAFAFPGDEGHTVVDLQPGEYLAVCFIPVGLTPEVAQSGEEPHGAPHFTEGMKHEFTVS